LIQFQNSKTDTTSIGSLLIKNFYTESKPRIKIIFSDKSTWDNYEIVD